MILRIRRLAVAALILAGTRVGMGADKCFECHTAIADKPSTQFAHDIHHRAGVTCAGCHGGDATTDDPEKAMNKEGNFIGVPKGDVISARCAACHADSVRMAGYHVVLPANQFALLKESVHGQKSISGKERIVQCTTCHGAHGIVPVRDPASPVSPLKIVATCSSCHSNATYMRAYNPALPVDQREKYRTSVHGMKNARGDAKVAECVSCHGTHGILPVKDVRSKVFPVNLPSTCANCHSNAAYMKPYGIPTDQYEKFTRSVHGIALLKKNDLGAPACNSCHGNHGAAPPDIESVSKVCGICHSLNADLFAASPHKQAFDERHLPECETCHGNHDIEPATSTLLGVSSDAVCSRCHTPTDNPRGYSAAQVMRLQIDSLELSEQRAQALVAQAEQEGMEISEAKYRLRDIHQARLEARTTVHAFNAPRFATAVDKGLVVSASVAIEAQGALDEYIFRRIGLGISTLIISILAASLYLYIRRIEKR